MRLGTKLAIALIGGFVVVGSVGIILGSSAFSDQQALTDPDSTEETPTATADEATQTASATSTPSPDTATPTSDTTPDDDPSGETSEPAGLPLNESDIAGYVADYVNDRRDSDLSTTSTSAGDLYPLAQNHSRTMADASYVAHDVGYGDSGERYERNDLFERCQFTSERYVGVIDADNNLLESIGSVDADDYYHGAADEAERDIARAIVDDWFGSDTYRERLTWENAEHLGVGVVLSEDNRVYVTANVC